MASAKWNATVDCTIRDCSLTSLNFMHFGGCSFFPIVCVSFIFVGVNCLQGFSRMWKNIIKGEVGQKSYRLFFQDSKGKVISPWHDIPLQSSKDRFNFICEIPKFGRDKMEVSTKEANTPIAQDLTGSGDLRQYHGPIFWNYGCFPQTWEDPNHLHPEIKCFGDNDPLDVVEIGSAKLLTGSITPVKVLGVLGLVDKGELDWKVIAINEEDEIASRLDDIKDLEVHCPHVITGIREWFRWYKTPDGKALNKYGFGECALGKKDTLAVIEETNLFWSKLRTGVTENKDNLWIK